jgi:anti-sigma factor RsiW
MTSYEDLPCDEAVTMVTDYFERALPAEQRAILERHLAWCDWCATYVQQMRETIRMAGTLRDEDVPAPVMDVLLAAFREMRQS